MMQVDTVTLVVAVQLRLDEEATRIGKALEGRLSKFAEIERQRKARPLLGMFIRPEPAPATLIDCEREQVDAAGIIQALHHVEDAIDINVLVSDITDENYTLIFGEIA
jgi:hypothetical protein